MTRKLLGTAAAAVLAMGMSQALAAPVLIDNFNTTQTLVANGASATDSGGVVAGVDSIGGARYAEIANTAGSTGQSALNINNLANPNPYAAYSNDSNTQSMLTMKWDGTTAGALTANGLGGVDLSDGGSENQITIQARSDLSGLAGAVGTITVYSSATNFSSISFGLPGLGTAVPFSAINLLFASFAIGGGTGADFTNVGAIVLELTGPQSLDAQIDFIGTTSNVPEPMALGILGLGLAGFGMVRRRRKAA